MMKPHDGSHGCMREEDKKIEVLQKTFNAQSPPKIALQNYNITIAYSVCVQTYSITIE